MKRTGGKKKGGRRLESITPRETPREVKEPHSGARAKHAAGVGEQIRAVCLGVATGPV